jgi:hypothetical protein
MVRSFLIRWFGAWLLTALAFVVLLALSKGLPGDLWLSVFLATALVLMIHAAIAVGVLLPFCDPARSPLRHMELVVNRMIVGVLATIPGSVLLMVGVVDFHINGRVFTAVLCTLAGALGGAIALRGIPNPPRHST